MNFLGPIGLTVAFAWALNWVLKRLRKRAQQIVEPSVWHSTPSFDGGGERVQLHFADRFARSIDYRLIVIGALVPDLIDKPLAFVIDPDFVNYSLRSVGHSVAGGISMMTFVWIVTRGWKRSMVPSFGFALVGHSLFDKMWEMPEVLFWPVLGVVLPEGDVPFSHWYRDHFSQLPTTPFDLIGMAILILFIGHVLRTRFGIRFLKTGQWW